MNRPEIRLYKNNEMSKKDEVTLMFDKIAQRYDFMNHLLSLNIDKIWRRKAAKQLSDSKTEIILDAACGTGDLAISVYKKIKPKEIIGIDLSEKMLEYGRRKTRKLNLNHVIRLQQGDSEQMEFKNNTFDAVTVAFGVRNFENFETGIAEMYRVLKPGGKLVILEFSQPQKFPVKQIYCFYFSWVLPFIAKLFSKNPSAYSYLNKSVDFFPYGQAFIDILNAAGFKQNSCLKLTFGIASIYTGIKLQ
jgi:demethylmenaquinone methyltransferase/2-methoxy-6-polyprenyl-1,4-benzoquinol methylase